MIKLTRNKNHIDKITIKHKMILSTNSEIKKKKLFRSIVYKHSIYEIHYY